MILDARAGADFDELAAFLPAAGARTVLCSAEAAQALPFPRRATGEIMALRERAAPVEEADVYKRQGRQLHRFCAQQGSRIQTQGN